ncbi:kinesin-like protein KIF23 [Drosophila bipectinata]|uniref:kinesin-like protein KIF23 n=1 Tax=Drosophila bipectinata TaxID=42026 RepID=UPI001C89356B|nr:kinesin-like protein KIF23 [Drosophila bipectinata]
MPVKDSKSITKMPTKQERSKSLAPAPRKQTFRRSISEAPSHSQLLEPLDQRRIHQQLLRVYLRIKPLGEELGGTEQPRAWLEQVPPSTVRVDRSALPSAPARTPQTPGSSHCPASRSTADLANAGASPGTGTTATGLPGQMEFRFRSVLSECATQLLVFRTVGEAALRQLYTGGSGLILVTGAGGSGKTHTLLGPHPRDTIEGGLLYRCINAVFRSAGCEFVDRCQILANDSGTGFRMASDKKAPVAATHKERAAADKHRTDCLWQTGGVKLLTHRRKHACFLGALMVHEGSFYDLLGEQPAAADETRPAAVILREDGRGRSYAVRGSRLEIRSVEEAEGLIKMALNRKNLWTGSGRSHLLVNVYLAFVEVPAKGTSIDCGQLTLVEVLAPETEVQKTRRPCDALKTVYTLKQCLSTLQFNQLAVLKGRNQRKRPPHRESSLTQFLGHFFDVSQPANVVCLATVSLDPKQAMENVRALSFAEETINLSCPSLKDEQPINSFLEESIEPFGVSGQVVPTFLDRNIRPDYKAIRTVRVIDIPPFDNVQSFISQLRAKLRRRRNFVQLSKDLAKKLQKQLPGREEIFGLQKTAIKEVEQRIKEMEPLIARLEELKTLVSYRQLSSQCQEVEKRAQVSENMMNARNQQLEHHMALKDRNEDLELSGDGSRRTQKEKRSPVWHYY